MSLSSSSSYNSEHSLVSATSRIVQDALNGVLRANHWQKLYMTAAPLVALAVRYLSRTVVRVSDAEQALWLQMWLSQQTTALSRVRHLNLLSSIAKRRGIRLNQRSRDADEEDKEEGGGRFAPPKLDFQPDMGVVTWTLHNWWPVSVSSIGDGYTLTIWFAPSARSIVKDLLFQGRDLWLAKRAKKTEIWMHRNGHGSFKIVTRPSRPLSSVVVEGNTKENLRQDAIHFLNSEQWYISKGIPYRRGYLLHGPPGCGKTSLITALAGDLRMPIVVIPLNDRSMDDSSLMRVLGDAPKNSLVLIEDIDCALPKETSQLAVASMRSRYGGTPITLSGLLNAIDGVGAQEGRLLFMTTNHVDRLDAALIRPGRVDLKFHLDNASKVGAGELFDQFFASSSLVSGKESTPAMIRTVRRNFLKKVENGAHSFASLQGVFMSAKDDPAHVLAGMDKLVASPEAGQDPTKASAYDKAMEIEKARKEALEKEREIEESQRDAGKTVVKRLIGNPTHTMHHNPQLQQIIFSEFFPTFGAPDKLTTSGVLYYEIELIKSHGAVQAGFALNDGLPLSELDSGDGVGDNGTSWAVDGLRRRLWHNGDTGWKGFWTENCVLGLAANTDTGMIAVSKDGDWGGDGALGFGLVFRNEAIKKGVYPAISAQFLVVRYYFEGDDSLKYGPPPESVWSPKLEEKKEKAAPIEKVVN